MEMSFLYQNNNLLNNKAFANTNNSLLKNVVPLKSSRISVRSNYQCMNHYNNINVVIYRKLNYHIEKPYTTIIYYIILHY